MESNQLIAEDGESHVAAVAAESTLCVLADGRGDHPHRRAAVRYRSGELAVRNRRQQPGEAAEAVADSTMKSVIRKEESGIALIIVMISVTVLGILAAAFAYSMKVETKLAQNANSETELIWLGRSGVERARWYILANRWHRANRTMR